MKKKLLPLTLIFLGIMMVTSSYVTAQTDFYSGPVYGKKIVNDTQYMLRGVANMLTITTSHVVSGTMVENDYVVPNYDNPQTTSSISEYEMFDLSPNGNVIIGATLRTIPNLERSSIIFDGTSFLESKRISTNEPGDEGVVASKSLNNGFYRIFKLGTPGSKIGIAANYTGNAGSNGLPYTYDNTVGSLQYVIAYTDFNGDYPKVVGSINGSYGLAGNNNILSELNGNLLLKYSVGASDSVRYFEMDKNNGNIINTYNLNGPGIITQHPNGNIYIAHSSFNPNGGNLDANSVFQDTISIYDSAMNPLGIVSPRLTRKILGMDFTPRGLAVTIGNDGLLQEVIFLDENNLTLKYMPKIEIIERNNGSILGINPNLSLYQFDANGDLDIVFSYNDVPTLLGNPVMVNGLFPPAPASGQYMSCSYKKDMSPANMTLGTTTVAPIISMLPSAMLNATNTVQSSTNSIIVYVNQGFNLDALIGTTIDFSLLNIPNGYNIWPNPAAPAAALAELSKYSFGNIQYDEYGNIYTYIGIYDDPTIMNHLNFGVNKKFYRVYFKNALAILDTDGDGVVDSLDAFPNNPNESVDSDLDGVGDNADVFPNNPNESVDSDFDGVGDNADAFPNDGTKWLAVNTGIDNIADINISLYPNPVVNVLNIQTDEKITSIEVIDYSGRIVKMFNGNQNQIFMGDMPNGVYFVKIGTKDNSITEKIIKK